MGGLCVSGQSRTYNISSPWRCIVNVGKDLAKCDINFNLSFEKSFGEGKETLFWEDRLIGDKAFKGKFARLYRLETTKDVRVSDRIHWDGSVVSHNWSWTRPLSGRANSELAEMKAAIITSVFNNSSRDVWKWNLHEKGFYCTKTLSHLIDEKMYGNNSVGVTDVNRLVPKSLNVFAWRVKRRRIPVRVELDKRGIDLDSVRCSMCDDSLETIDHALILCKIAYEIWVRVYRWWGLGTPTNLSTGEMFNGVGNFIRDEEGKRIWQAVEWVSGYII
ncbi:uncharacterized protein [Rutidosis leptorrhynchoides]|uniref:uncharacterized protein n=1 Tax=Rutidosis leptorrhynchoides TaxID=125765 RepID=UPI003A992DA3